MQFRKDEAKPGIRNPRGDSKTSELPQKGAKNAARLTATKMTESWRDRIIKTKRWPQFMILSRHDSVCLRRSQKKSSQPASNPSYWSAKEYFRFFGLKHTFYLPVHALKRGSAIGSREPSIGFAEFFSLAGFWWRIERVVALHECLPFIDNPYRGVQAFYNSSEACYEQNFSRTWRSRADGPCCFWRT